METTHKSVATLLGDPKKAILRMSGPMMLAMLMQTLYNLVDAIWVAGLGPNALAAVGGFFPIFMIIISLAAGLGIGANAVVAQRIGARDKAGAENAAKTAVVLVILLGAIMTLLSLIFIRPALILMGQSDDVLQLCLEYSYIILPFTIVFMLTNLANAILRAEGDAKRAMVVIVVGSILNMVLDPVLIYSFKLHVAGAAYATVISASVGLFMSIYWFLIRKSTYLSLSFDKRQLDLSFLWKILSIGIPASLAQLSMSVAIFILNRFASIAAGAKGLAVFTSAWRIINFGTIPMLGIAAAVTSVVGAAYGARDIDKLEKAQMYAIKLGLIIGICVMAIIQIFSKQIAFLFAYSSEGGVIFHDIVSALRALSLFLPGTPFGMFTSAMFQGIGHGVKSLVVTIFRTLIMQVFFCWLFVNVMKIGLEGVWWGIVIGNLTNAVVAFSWGKSIVRNLKQNKSL
ncbi:MAG: MATE family efflux transporter [Pseudothermotoga sp.]|uniref:MATE family efflux transporter n=1 Tax=Pseudothermotoga sp. TaxID=2033661 RepID=UPI0025858681|nr:MATE family efflux transporter [Pseudothermotoga sp.]MDI6862175.1 MATE family efflux transporter [Pseudothermotoga sp.]